MKTYPNDPAYPATENILYGSEDQFSRQEFHIGLTKREYFTGMAMQGLVANSAFYLDKDNPDIHNIHRASVLIADALITQLIKQP